MIRLVGLFVALIIIDQHVAGQHLIPLKHDISWQMERVIANNNIPIHLSHKPYHEIMLDKHFSQDTVLLQHLDTSKSKPWLYRKLRTEHLANVHTDNFRLNLDVLFDFRFGNEHETGRSTFRNTRAGQVEGQLGRQITFYSRFYENQAVFPTYLDSFIREYWIVPGQGVKRDFGETGFDFNWAQGGISWTPTHFLQFELGYGKKFIGSGYRSLILSDNAFSYPHMSVILENEKVKYVKSYASLMHNIHNVNLGNYLFNRKFFTSHYLNFNLLQGDLQVGLFEGNVWANPDSTGQFDYNPLYLNPVPLLSSLTKDNNSVIGINVVATIFNTAQVYSQFVLDDQKGDNQDFADSHVAVQFGAKYFDVFGLDGLFALAELNATQPHTFAHVNSLLSYSHYNQPLGHPVGANFLESVFHLNYRKKSVFLSAQFNFIRYWEYPDAPGYPGRDISKPIDSWNYPRWFHTPTDTNIHFLRMEMSYILNPLTNMNFTLGYQARNLSNNIHSSVSSIIFVAFRTSLSNFYYDF
jgi:hypothetical protein